MLAKDKAAYAAQCCKCQRWILIGFMDKKPVALETWSLDQAGRLAMEAAGLKVYSLAADKSISGPLRAHYDWHWPSHEWKPTHPCPIDQVMPPEATAAPWAPPCEPAGTIPPASCTRTPEGRDRGAVSCDGCEPVPFDRRSPHELLVSELGATVLRIEANGEVLYRAH